MSIGTLADLLFHVRDVSGGRPDLLTVRFGERREAFSTTDFVRHVHSLALALESRGLAKGDRVAIFSESRPEWHIVDFACQLLGAPTVPLYPALPPAQVGYVLRNSGSRWVFFSDAAKRDLLLELESAFTSPPQMVALESEAAAPGGASLTRLMGEGAARRGEVPIERFRGRLEEDDLASIIYTSGTTGDPKGVMLSHRNLISNVLACGEIFDLGPRDLALSFLPLSHGLQRTVDHLCFYRGTAIHYVPSSHSVPPALREVRPTVLVAVPRVYERAYVRTLARAREDGPMRQKLFRWAVDVGRRHAAALRDGFVGPLLAVERQLAERLVFHEIQQRFGGRMRIAISGGASLGREVVEFFEAVGVPIFEGYGLTETSPMLASNAPDRQRPGSVGKALSEVELRLAEDGEILAKGPGVMQGYWENPEATAASVDDSGWLHTGDVGRIDQSGYLFVTARKQDLLVTAGGESVAPLPIEQALAGRGPIAQAVVVGDERPYLAALLVPDLDQLRTELGDLPPADLVAHPEVVRRVEAVVEEVNTKLGEAEKIRRFTLLEHGFAVERGELTPTGKLRRRVIDLRYAETIARLYSDDSDE